jgi:tRNA1Val (adenine37-N6)-methyltransferase
MKRNRRLTKEGSTREHVTTGRGPDDCFSSALPLDDETVDALFDGALKLYQRKRGYRFSLDSLLLADFATIRPEDRVIDLGTGNGVMPLILAYRYRSISVTGVEVQREMADRAERNVRLNGYDGRIAIACMDISSATGHFIPESFDSVICNPPYRAVRSGRLSPSSEKQIARHELKASLEDFVQIAASLMRNKGRFACIQLADRTVDLLMQMRSAGIEPKRLRVVHPFAAARASMILVEAVKGGRSGLEVLPPLIVYDAADVYTAELNAIMAGARLSC